MSYVLLPLWLDYLLRLARRIAVESNEVSGTRGNAAERTAAGKSLDTGTKRRWGSATLQAQEVGTKTSNVRSSHRGARDGVGRAARPRREDVLTGSEDVHDGAVVGEGGSSIGRSGGTDSEDGWLRGRGCSASINIAVACSDGQEDARRNQGSGSLVNGSGKTATKRHIGDGAIGAVSGRGITGHKVDAGNDVGECAASTVVKDLYTIEQSLLGNTIRAATDGTRHMSAMTVAVSVLARDKGLEQSSTALKFLYRGLLLAAANGNVFILRG